MSFEKWRALKTAIADAEVKRPDEDFQDFYRRGRDTASLEHIIRGIIDTLDEIIERIPDEA